MPQIKTAAIRELKNSGVDIDLGKCRFYLIISNLEVNENLESLDYISEIEVQV